MVNISYTANRADEMLTFDIYASSGTCGYVILPVSVTYFNAFYSDHSISARWETATEMNSDYFTVQISEDGKHFKDYTRVNAAGNSLTAKKYRADIEYDNSNADIIYIRLKEVDRNGAVSFPGPVVSAEVSQRKNEIKILDNTVVVTGYTTLRKVELVSVDGKTSRYAENFNSDHEAILDISDLPQGFFLLKVNTADEKTSIYKIVK